MDLKKIISRGRSQQSLFLILILTAYSMFASAGLSQQRTPIKAADPDVSKLMDVWVAMWNSYDLAQVDRLFLADERVTYFSSEKEGLIRGFEAVRKHHEGFGFIKGGKVQKNKLWVENLQIDIFGTTAVVAGIWYFERGEAVADKPKVQRGPVTAVLVNLDGEYRIAHMNFGNYK